MKPDYTEEGRRRHIEGDVVLEIVVRRDGTVGSVKLLQGLGAGLDQRAIDAVRQWRFSPAKRYGTPVDVIVEVAMEFKLGSRSRSGVWKLEAVMDTTLVDSHSSLAGHGGRAQRDRVAHAARRTRSAAKRASRRWRRWRRAAPRRARAAAATCPLAARAPRRSRCGATVRRRPEQASPWGQRFAVMAGARPRRRVASILFALAASGTKTAARRGRGAGRRGDAAAPARRAGAAVAARHAAGRIADDHRPGAQSRSGAPLSRVTVTAYTFDDKGAFLASGRALIDVTALAPGDESPFVVTVPVTETVARYRIGFRGEDGRVIAHVDKRQQAPIAAHW